MDKTTRWKLFAVLLACLLTAAIAPPTADELVAKNLEARGGAAKFSAVQSMTVTGRIDLGGGLAGPFFLRMKRPSQFRVDMTLNDSKVVQTYEGNGGWQIMPFDGNKDPQQLQGDKLTNMREQAENGIGGPLADYKARGNKVEFLGEATVEGKRCYKLRITLSTGNLIDQFLDADSYLEIAEELRRKQNGKDFTILETVGDYKRFDGLLFACLFASHQEGAAQGTTLTIEKIELNTPIDPAIYKMPSTP